MDRRDTREYGLSRSTAAKILEGVKIYDEAVERTVAPRRAVHPLRYRMYWNNRILQDAITRCGSRDFYPADIKFSIQKFTVDPPVETEFSTYSLSPDF